jgi:cysteinyl-tRNA synthetase
MTEIALHNTRTRRKEPLAPADPRNVRLYVCGPTVYDRAHIGNARPVVVFDVLYRLLRHRYGPGHVTYVRNITDVDDKINARALETRRAGESALDAVARITGETTRWFHEDMDALGALRPDREPRATEYIPDMIAMIARLVEEGHAYAAEGHVLFSVASYAEYGRLSGRSVDEMRAGARVEVAPYKRDPMDFVLWKPSGPDEPGWDSPWGRGRPGWHIECSAMARALLGEVIDIHGGGIDLVFPHHENEVAQSCCANHTEIMARHWLHNGYVMVEGEKMSKSLGNFTTVKDLRDRGVPGEVIRMVLLMTHYRAPLDWTGEKVEEATRLLDNWARFKRTCREAGFLDDVADAAPDLRVIDALADDLNTPKAKEALHQLHGEAKLARSGETAPARFFATLEWLGFTLEGLSLPAIERTVARDFDTVEEASNRIEALLAERKTARKARDFARADAIRDGLKAAGVEVHDTPEGTTWELTRGFDPARLDDLEALQ